MPRLIIKIVWFFSVMLIVLLSTLPAGAPSFVFHGADKVEHFSAYAWLSVLPFTCFKKQSNVFFILLSLIFLSGILEICQIAIVGRTASNGDMIANIFGVAFGGGIGLRARKLYTATLGANGQSLHKG